MSYKTRIISALVFLLFIIVSVGSYKFVDYQKSQEYAKVATEQFEDDATYQIMQTQNSMSNVIKWSFIVIWILGTLVYINTWIPLKEKSKE